MTLRFLGSPASCFLASLTFEFVYLGLYLTHRANLPALAGAFIACSAWIGIFLVLYARSLYWHADFPGRVVFWLMGQAVMAGFTLAVPISIGIFRAWEPWGYLLLAWAVTLVFNFGFDILLVGLYFYRVPVMQFMVRSQ
jgi:hypothetical protein